MREAWVRLCGTYQSKGGVLVNPHVRSVRLFIYLKFVFLFDAYMCVVCQALQEIATLYFAIPPPQTQPVNPLGQMLSSMFGTPEGSAPKRRVLMPTGTSSNGPELD